MYATKQHLPIHWSENFRWLGRASGVTLFVIWTAFVIGEFFHPESASPIPAGLYYQATALAVVFAGYAVGWKKELVGAGLVAAGLLAFLVITLADTKILPSLPTAWFAAPGVFYALAHYQEQREQKPDATSA